MLPTSSSDLPVGESPVQTDSPTGKWRHALAVCYADGQTEGFAAHCLSFYTQWRDSAAVMNEKSS